MILLIEDDPDIRLLAELSLKLDGLEVCSCADGASGLRALEQQTFDLVILDIMMPDMSGYDVLDEINNRMAGNTPPVALFTARPADSMKCDSRRPGVVALLQKPFVPDELVSTVRKLIQSES